MELIHVHCINLTIIKPSSKWQNTCNVIWKTSKLGGVSGTAGLSSVHKSNNSFKKFQFQKEKKRNFNSKISIPK